MIDLFFVYQKLRENPAQNLLYNSPQYALRQLRKAYYQRKLHANETKIAERRCAALEKLTTDSTILFLCHGNICRSPFAERYTRQELETRKLSGISVTSAGLLHQPEQQSPPNARTAARCRGVDLTDNCSDQIDIKSVEQADLILLMDYRNYHNFTARFPDAADRMYFLGIFDDSEGIAISDPNNDTLDAFEHSYDRIIFSVDGLLDEFESRQESRPHEGIVAGTEIS